MPTKEPVTSSSSGTTKKTAPKTLKTFDDLKLAVPDYEDRSWEDILVRLTSGGYSFTSDFFKMIQDSLLRAESEGKGSVASFVQPSRYSTDSGGSNRATSGLGPSGTGQRDYLAEQNAADAAAMARLQEQLKLDRERIAEDKRQNLLNTARQLVEARMTERTAARNKGADLAGNDPFLLTGSLQGVALGSDIQTPYDIFKNQVGSVATQPVDQLNPNASIGDLESAIQKLSGPSEITGVPFVGGFEQGGTANAVGPYEARLIGEKGSQIAPGTEVLITGNGKATVIPLQQGLQAGGSVDLDNVSLGTFPTAFQNLRRSLGVNQDTGTLSAGNRAALGFASEGGVPMGQAQFGGGLGQLGTPLTLERGLRDLQKTGLIDEAGVQRLTQLIGYLPNPRQAASQFSKLNPAEKLSLLSAYKLAGIDKDSFNALVQSATLTGAARSGINLAA